MATTTAKKKKGQRNALTNTNTITLKENKGHENGLPFNVQNKCKKKKKKKHTQQ